MHDADYTEGQRPTPTESYGERLARDAAASAAKAYAWAAASENPYAAAMVTARLAEGNLILLSTARREAS